MPLKRNKPVSMHRTLAGLPELEQFESEEQKQRALAELEKEAGNPLSWDWVIGVGILIAVVVTTTFTLRWLTHRIPVVADFPRHVHELIRVGTTIVVFLVMLRWLHRWGAGEQLREKLIAAGVPVCRGCGYSLKGLPADVSKCSECGRVIEADVMKLIRPPPSS